MYVLQLSVCLYVYSFQCDCMFVCFTVVSVFVCNFVCMLVCSYVHSCPFVCMYYNPTSRKLKISSQIQIFCFLWPARFAREFSTFAMSASEARQS